jgi:hypothetical protein
MDDENARAAKAREGSPFLNTKQAAHYLNLSPRTLATMRCDGRGPLCRKHGATWRYHIDDLEAWSRMTPEGGRHD